MGEDHSMTAMDHVAIKAVLIAAAGTDANVQRTSASTIARASKDGTVGEAQHAEVTATAVIAAITVEVAHAVVVALQRVIAVVPLPAVAPQALLL